MDIGKSLKVGLAMRGKSQIQLAAQLKCTHVWVSALANKRMASMATIERLSAALDMKVSDFIRLGEDDGR